MGCFLVSCFFYLIKPDPELINGRFGYICWQASCLVLAHAKAYRVYDSEFRPTQKGVVGIANNCDWREPLTDSDQDKASAQRALEFYFGWFTDPLFFGQYPESMRISLKDLLPSFSEEESAWVKNSVDFIGLNHYTTFIANYL